VLPLLTEPKDEEENKAVLDKFGVTFCHIHAVHMETTHSMGF